MSAHVAPGGELRRDRYGNVRQKSMLRQPQQLTEPQGLRRDPCAGVIGRGAGGSDQVGQPIWSVHDGYSKRRRLALTADWSCCKVPVLQWQKPKLIFHFGLLPPYTASSSALDSLTFPFKLSTTSMDCLSIDRWRGAWD